ncbi:DUF4214 domain-containing protein [Methylobacterium sp. sgz302541]|uniref:DUF4214 domain-containing protein n=1 Tax=unclassified Methylobacterium TaxID=2615210 RepID=UPI003D33065E
MAYHPPGLAAPAVAIGTIAGDDVVNAAEHAGLLSISGTTTGIEDGRTLTLGLAGARYQVTVTGGVWTVSVPASAVGALSDAGSLYRVSADVSDLAGTAAPQASRALAVDTGADMGDAATLGVGITPDRIVNAPESAFVPFRVTGLDADAHALATFSDGTHVAQAEVLANGAYRIDLSGFDGPVTGTLAITDTAGNRASATGNTIIVDQKAPVTFDPDGPGAPRVALTRDSGLSATDGVTSDAHLTVTPAGGELALVTMVDGQVVSSYDPSTLADGRHVVTVTPIDGLGRALSAGTASFTLDRAAPQVAVTGASGDARLVDHVLSGSLGAEDAGASVTVRDGGTLLGTAIADAQGAWSLPFAFEGDGTGHAYALAASVTDAAGNAGTSDVFHFALDFSGNRPLFETVVHDAHGAAAQVHALYEALLDRAPDLRGWEGWVPAIEHGMTAHDLAAQLLNSAEYAARFGSPAAGSGADFVAHLYETALHREAGAGEIGYWTDALASGSSRADVATAIAFSAENTVGIEAAFRSGVAVPDAAAAEAARLYHGLLDRAPDAAGLSQAVAALHDGASLGGIARGLLDSAEYAALHPVRASDADFLGALYQDALGRGAGGADAQPWLDALAQGVSRADVAVAVAESAEAMQHLAGRIETGWHLHG